MIVVSCNSAFQEWKIQIHSMSENSIKTRSMKSVDQTWIWMRYLRFYLIHTSICILRHLCFLCDKNCIIGIIRRNIALRIEFIKKIVFYLLLSKSVMAIKMAFTLMAICSSSQNLLFVRFFSHSEECMLS